MTTKEEKFLLELGRQATETEETANPEDIGAALGFSTHQVKMIVRTLAQGNLIKKYSPEEIALTSRGLEALRSLS